MSAARNRVLCIFRTALPISYMALDTVSDVDLSKDQLERHARHVSLRGFGAAGNLPCSSSYSYFSLCVRVIHLFGD